MPIHGPWNPRRRRKPPADWRTTLGLGIAVILAAVVSGTLLARALYN